MKNIQDFTEFLNETTVKIPMGAVRGDEIRINALENKVYLVNFDKIVNAKEKEKFLGYVHDQYGTILTNITNHLGDLVITFSIYITNAMANNFKEILNDIFVQRAEDNQEQPDSGGIQPKEPEGLLDGDTANKKKKE